MKNLKIASRQFTFVFLLLFCHDIVSCPLLNLNVNHRCNELNQIHNTVICPTKVLLGNDLTQHYEDIFCSNIVIQTLVIDPGHGGKDGGCNGKNSLEKNITLSIAKNLERRIKETHPEIKVIMTRQKDIFVPLHERAAIANKNNADLFISIHCNALGNPKIGGTETYVMGLHTAKENLMVAKRENKSIFYELDFKESYQGFDPNSNEGQIYLEMFQNVNLEQSMIMADLIEQEFKNVDQRKSRGVKQAGFLVLRETVMPAVLVETGYLTHKKDNLYLISDSGQKAVAASILRALGKFKANNLIQSSPAPKAEPVVVISEEKIEQKVSSPIISTSPRAPEQEIKVESEKVIVEPAAPARKRYEFFVQLGAFSTTKSLGQGIWKGISNLIEVKEKGLYKYQIQGLESMQAAEKLRMDMQSRGFPDAFIVVLEDGKKISYESAIQIFK